MKTETTTPTIFWTSFNGEWMLRSNVRLTECEWVTVTSKSGKTQEVKVGEYEKRFKNPDGTESHIFSICHI